MSGVRRGVAGVRLCDRPGCHHPWPCGRCGVRQAHNLQHGYEALSDDPACRSCGFQRCGCATVAPPPPTKRAEPRFQVGDRVRCVDATPGLDIGDEGFVARVIVSGRSEYIRLQGGTTEWNAARFELVAPKPKREWMVGALACRLVGHDERVFKLCSTGWMPNGGVVENDASEFATAEEAMAHVERVLDGLEVAP